MVKAKPRQSARSNRLRPVVVAVCAGLLATQAFAVRAQTQNRIPTKVLSEAQMQSLLDTLQPQQPSQVQQTNQVTPVKQVVGITPAAPVDNQQHLVEIRPEDATPGQTQQLMQPLLQAINPSAEPAKTVIVQTQQPVVPEAAKASVHPSKPKPMQVKVAQEPVAELPAAPQIGQTKPVSAPKQINVTEVPATRLPHEPSVKLTTEPKAAESKPQAVTVKAPATTQTEPAATVPTVTPSATPAAIKPSEAAPAIQAKTTTTESHPEPQTSSAKAVSAAPTTRPQPAKVPAQPKTPAPPTSSLFRTESGPPPGFAAAVLAQKQTTIVSVYYNDKFLTNVTASFNDNHIQFLQPDDIVKQLVLSPKPGTDAVVLKALSSELATHSANVCENGGEHNYCKAIEPQVAGVIFDQNSFRADLFINPDYLPTAKQLAEAPLPAPTAGFSYMAQNQLFVNATNGDQAFSLNNNSVFGYLNNRVNIISNTTYQHQSDAFTDETNTPETQVNFTQIAYTHIQNRSAWQGGVIYSANGDFITQQNILGANYTNHSEEVAQFVQNQRLGSPLYVHLTLPSRVTVLRNGDIIDTEQLSAGNHILNSSNFPNGTYQVTIRITNSLGQTTTQTQVYTKQTQLAPVGHPYYTISAGILQNPDQTDYNQTVTLPQYKAIPLLAFNMQYSFSYHWGANATVMTDVDRSFFDVNIPYYGAGFQVGPSVILSTANDYGLGANGQYNSPWGLSANVFALDMFSSSGEFNPGDNTDNVNSLSASNFNPLPTSDYIVQTGLNYSFSRYSFGLTGSWNKNQDESSVNSYGATFGMSLFGGGGISGMLNTSFTKSSQNGDTLSAGITFNFSAQTWTASLSGGYTRQTVNQDESEGVNGTTDSTATYAASVGKSFAWGHNDNNQLQLGGSYQQQGPETRFFDGTVNYQGPIFATNMTLTHYLPTGEAGGNDQNSTTLVGEIDSNFGVAGNHAAIGYSGSGYVTGAIVRIDSPEQTKVQVLSNGNDVANVSTNSSHMIFLQPYHTYNFTIVPIGGKTFLKYNPTPKRITVYKGNIKYLHWQLAREYIFFGKIVWPDGKPVASALLDDSALYDATDDKGFLQASLTSDQHVLRFTTINRKHCEVTLPAKIYSTKAAYVEAGTLTCQPYTPKKATPENKTAKPAPESK